MLRTLLLLGFLAAVGFTVFKWATSGQESATHVRPQTAQNPDETDDDHGKAVGPAPAPVTRQTEASVSRLQEPLRHRDPLVVPDARVLLVNYPELGAQRTGKILFLGTKVPAKEMKSD